jgi:hypothetical protein
MSAAEMLAGAAPGRAPDWYSLEGKKVWRTVCRLQARIVKAVVKAAAFRLLTTRKQRSTPAADGAASYGASAASSAALTRASITESNR